jgi:subtilase family serine protease
MNKSCSAFACLAIPALLLTSSNGLAESSQGRYLTGHTVQRAAEVRDLGPESTSQTLRLTVWLHSKMDSAAADQMITDLYDKNSPNFHHWLSQAQADAAFAPTAAQAATVRKYLEDRHLREVASDPSNYFIKVEGTVRDIQEAFRVQIHRFDSRGTSFRSNVGEPWVDGSAATLIAAIDGMSEHKMRPHLVRPKDPATGESFHPSPLAAGPDGAFFEAQCLRKPQTKTFKTMGGLPSATYAGNRYGANIENSADGTLAPCGYQPSELQAAYGLKASYAAGFDGSGQTTVIVDAFGSPTIAQDSEIFSQLYGLPDITPANFKVLFPGGQPAAPDEGWATETTLDVQWAHAMAPGAKIVLLAAPTPNDADLQTAILYALEHNLGKSISNSYGEAEHDVPPAILANWYLLTRLAAALGVSVNFSSGDNGDSNPSGFTDNVSYPGVSTPADMPWATGVGGTSVFLDNKDNITTQTGWGNNITEVADTIALGSPPVIPPFNEGFDGGAGGGTSEFFPKPDFQAGLPGKHRLVPDIAVTADPFTGVEIICDGGSCGGGTGPLVEVIGGTSLACPMFSGIWSIANQGRKEGLGQAARLLYRLKKNAITDVLAVNSPDNVIGLIQTGKSNKAYSAKSLVEPLDGTTKFVSALYNSPFSTRWFVLSFGTDSSLATAKGWDNVTGLGTPDGLSFIRAVRSAVDD